MLDLNNRDDRIYLVLSSADLQTAAAFSLFDAATNAAREQKSDEVICIDWRQINNASVVDLTLEAFIDTAGDGTPAEANRIDRLLATAAGGGVGGAIGERFCPHGTAIKGRASAAGQVYMRLSGCMLRVI
jgi:hypothetical protein